jgi:heme exporter protein B
MRDVMLPLLLYPLTIPLIIAGVEATRIVLEGGNPGAWLQVLAGVDIVFLGMSAGLFRWVLSAVE